MKYARMSGLAVVAVLALIGVVGTGTASAEGRVCSNQGTAHGSCADGLGKVYSGGIHTILGESNATLTFGVITVSCDSTVQGEVNGASGTGGIRTLTFSSCDGGCSASSTATHASPWIASTNAIGEGNGTMEIWNVRGQITCTIGVENITCIYADALVGDKGEIVVTGGSTATVKATNVALTRQAGSSTWGCNETATWSGTYSVTTPDSLWIGEDEPFPPSGTSGKACSAAGAGEACGGGHGNAYNGEAHTALGKSNAALTSSFVTVICDSTMQGEITNGSTGTGHITALTFANCTSPQASNCSATSTASGTNKWAAKITKGTAPNGTLFVTNVRGQFTCTVFGIKTTCYYGKAWVGDKGEIAVTGGSTATVKATGVKLELETGSGFGCSATGTWSAVYSITTPDSLWVT